MLKKVVSSILAVTLLAGSVSTVSASAAENSGNTDNPKLETITVRCNNNAATYYDQNGDEVDPTLLNADVEVEKNLPSSYDLRDYGRSTGVKNQGNEGMCWAFASTASMESNILTKGLGNETADTLDLSEGGNSWYVHTSTTDKTSPLYNEYISNVYMGSGGGLPSIAADSLSSGYGVYPESLLEYEKYSSGYSETMRFYSDYRLKEYIELDVNNTDLLKQRIIDVGAICYCYDSDSKYYYRNENGLDTYYDPVKEEELSSGHAITLIGWDDNFSKENFDPKNQPKNDGAWLCKNSYGESADTIKSEIEADKKYAGYLWISYESAVYDLAQFEMQSSDNLENVYQHQVEGSDYTKVAAAANIFTAEASEKLEQICFSNLGKLDANVSIYKLNENPSSPVDGKLLSSFDTSVEYTGAHMIECPDEILLSKGDVFSVVIKAVEKENNEFWVKIKADNYYSSKKAGKSYLFVENNLWTDIVDMDDISYAAIKAYTSNVVVDKSDLIKLVEEVRGYEVDQNIPQAEIDKFNKALDRAEYVLANDNATQISINNAYCVLKSIYEIVFDYYYYINSMDDYFELCEGLRKGTINCQHIELMVDLDFSDYANVGPLGDSENIFNAEFDGNGHTIKNYTQNGNGFFNRTNGAIIKDVTFDNAYVNGDYVVGIITLDAEKTKFINCNIKNSISRLDDGVYVALFAGNSYYCDFINCTVENCSVIGSDNFAALYTNDDNSANNVFENCTAKDYIVKSAKYVCDNMGCSVQIKINTKIPPCITITDDNCTIEDLFGNIESVECNGEQVSGKDGVYCFNKVEGKVIPEISYTEYKDLHYICVPILFDRSVKLNDYDEEIIDSEIVIPSEILGLPVTAIDKDFCFVSETLTSITLPKTIKSIAEKTLGYAHTDNGIMPIEGFVIKGYAGTAAEEYAKANGFTFVDLNDSYEIGDVNLDNEVDVKDVTYLQMYLAGYKNTDDSAMIDTTDKNMFKVADTNGDNVIDVKDVTQIQMMLAGLV